MQRTLGAVLVAAAMIALTGCASTGGGETTSVLVQPEQPSAVQDLDIALDVAQKSMQQAEAEFLKFYSPSHYRKAKKNLKLSQETYNKLTKKTSSFFDSLNPFSVKSKEKLFEFSALTKQEVEAGLQAKVLVKEQLDPALKQARLLDAINAKEHFASEYKQHLKDLRSIIIFIEQGSVESALSEQTVLVERMYATEVKTVKFVTLNPSKQALAQFESEEAETIAPILLQKARQKLVMAEQYIQGSPRDAEGVARVGTGAARSVEHLGHVISRIKTMQDKTPEQIVLEFESLLAPLLATTAIVDVSHEDLTAQTQALSNAFNKSRTQITDLKGSLEVVENDLKETNSLLSAAPAPAPAPIPAPEVEQPIAEATKLQAAAKAVEGELEISIEDMDDLFNQYDIPETSPEP